MRKIVLALSVLLLLAPPAWAALNGGGLISIFEELDLNGPEKRTVESLEEYISRNPRGESVDEALLRIGRIYSGQKELQKAASAYQKLLDNFPESKFRADASYELGLIAFRTGKLSDARLRLEPIASGNGVSLGLRAKAARLLKEVDSANYGLSGSKELPAIGVLLPLKGDYAAFGEDALNGVLLAANVFGGGPAQVEVVVKDCGADPSSIEAAMTELASEKKIAGVVGPLLSSTAVDAARYAQRLKVPVITLSQKEGVTDAGEYVFRNFLTPEDQTRALASYASNSLGKKRFAVLYPQNNYGVELARNFEASVKEAGGTVVRKAAYAQGTTDFSGEIKRIFGVQATERTEGRRKIREFTPTVKIDALFIPDSYEAVALIAPYLGYFNISGVQLLGANGWNSPKLVELAGRSVEGAVFVDGFFAASSRPGTTDFTARFNGAYGKEPGIISAQAYDAAAAIIQSLKGLSGADRDAVKERLRSLKGLVGAAGPVSFNSRREAEKRLFILTVENGDIKEIQRN